MSQSLLVFVLRPRRLREKEALGTRVPLPSSRALGKMPRLPRLAHTLNMHVSKRFFY